MKLRSGRYKWLTPPMSINEILPNEMLEAILLKLPTKDLLNCRSVSKLWKAFASYICRRRYVAANLYWNFKKYSKTKAFHDSFPETSDLPWSACRCLLRSWGDPVDLKKLKLFTDTFGPNIRKLEVHGDHMDLIMPALRQMPNLEILISGIHPSDEDIRKTCSGNRLELNKLKRLEITAGSSADVQLIEIICANSRKLGSILVKFGARWDVDGNDATLDQADYRRLIGTISRIPSIALNLSCNGTLELFQTLTVPELKIKELQFQLLEEDVHDQYYRALEKFLAGNSNCLEKLGIGSREGGGGTSNPLRTPVFSKLKELALDLGKVSGTTSHIQPFTSNQFPSLKKMIVLIPEEDDGVNGIPIFGTAQFDSVEELILRSSYSKNANPMSTDWSKIFPNVVTLDPDCVTVESYPYIYQNMAQLEHLSLTVHVVRWPRGYRGSIRGDSNSILSQYPKDTKKRNRGTVAQTPSLSSLTNLKTLTLKFLGCKIPDSKIHLALLKLRPLDCLTFRYIEISTEVKEKLSDYHGNVEVNPN